jgi:hypothetical protein
VDSVTQSALEGLAGSTERQIAALRRLAFKFEVQQMMLSGGRSMWLDETLAELEGAIADVQHADREFRSSLGEAAVGLALSPESTLREVAGVAPEPWGYIFDQGRDELQRSVDRVSALCTENRKLLARGYLATGAALSLLGVDTGSSYRPDGAPSRAEGSANLLNAKA